MLFPIARWYCIWLGAFVEKYFQGVLILATVLFVLYREALVVERLRRMPRMQEVVGSNPTESKICFSQFTLFYRVECEKLFCKTNLKLKVLKLIKTKFNAKPWRHKIVNNCFYWITIEWFSSSNTSTVRKCTVWKCACTSIVGSYAGGNHGVRHGFKIGGWGQNHYWTWKWAEV